MWLTMIEDLKLELVIEIYTAMLHFCLTRRMTCCVLEW